MNTSFSLLKRRRLPVARALWLVCVLLACSATSGAALAQEGHAALERVERAFHEGDERSLLAVAADRLEVSVFEVTSFYSRAQAMYVMQDFFRRHPPERFIFQEVVQSDGSLYAPGLYWSTSQSTPLQVYVRLHRTAQQWELREIRIEQRAR